MMQNEASDRRSREAATQSRAFRDMEFWASVARMNGQEPEDNNLYVKAKEKWEKEK